MEDLGNHSRHSKDLQQIVLTGHELKRLVAWFLNVLGFSANRSSKVDEFSEQNMVYLSTFTVTCHRWIRKK